MNYDDVQIGQACSVPTTAETDKYGPTVEYSQVTYLQRWKEGCMN
jgi:hypothetical protein